MYSVTEKRFKLIKNVANIAFINLETFALPKISLEHDIDRNFLADRIHVLGYQLECSLFARQNLRSPGRHNRCDGEFFVRITMEV